MAFTDTLILYVTMLNIVLIGSLLYVYGLNFKKLRSSFTLGLLFFTLLFFIQNIVWLYFEITMMPLHVEGVEPYIFTFTLLQTAAFAVLNWVTWK